MEEKKISIADQLAAEAELKEKELKLQRDSRRQIKRQARDRRRLELTKEIGLQESDPKKLQLQPRRCIWRDDVGLTNGLLDMLERQWHEDQKAGNAGMKRRSFIPVTKLTSLIGYWLGLYYAQTRAFQKASAGKLGAKESGSAESLAAPLLPDVVIRDRLKASKGREQVVETYIDILVRSIIQFKYVPRVYLFGLLCGLYPEDELGSYTPSAGLVFVAIIRQVTRDSSSFDISSLSKANTIWIAGLVAESVIRCLFADDHWWTMKLWLPDCKSERIKPMWADDSIKRVLNDDIKGTMSQVGNIEPKDRRALPPELKTAGFNARVCDLDKYLVVLLTTWLEQRRGAMERLDAVETKRLEKECYELEVKRQALYDAQDRAFSKEEVRYLKLGVKRHGIGYWNEMLKDDRLVFVHRTAERLEHEWNIITHRRERRERRRWDWRRWPWNPEWEWGALQVVPNVSNNITGAIDDGKERKSQSGNGGVEEKGLYREDWDVWDDMDITDDEKDKTLVQSSSADTATDDSDEDKEYYAKKERKNEEVFLSSGIGGSSSSQLQQQQAYSPKILSAILQNVALVSNEENSVCPPLSPEHGLMMHSVEEADDEEDREYESENELTFLTLNGDTNNMKIKSERHIKSQPLLPKIDDPFPSRMVKSQSAVLHLGHYQFGDKTAHALSQTLNSGDHQPTLGRDSGSRNRTNLDPGSKPIDTLVLRDNGMTSFGFASLSITLKGNSNITSLDLRRNKLGRKGLHHLSKVLRSFTCKIKYLDLDNTGIDDRGFIKLAEAFSQRKSKSLLPKAVEMGSGVDEPESVTEGTRKKKKENENEKQIEPSPSNLIEIHFGHNMISDASFAALDDMLGSLPSLTHLDLSWNRLKSKSAEILANRISNTRQCKISVLNVQFNSIGDYGACVLLSPVYAISPAPHLELLDMSFNGINISKSDVLNNIMNVITHSRNMRSLQMNGNEIVDEDFQTIRFALTESSNRKTGSLLLGLESSAVAVVYT
jgi:Ran GTPase-activating protein (RanGAP) involved in mRNA processing and transport